MSIRIVNLRTYKRRIGETLIKVDRTTPVGNPFPTYGDESKRDESCDRYQTYFDKKVTERTDQRFMVYLRTIYKTAQHVDIALGCWCAPKRCHSETIKAFIESWLMK